MSLAISLDDGALEYSGDGLSGLFAQKRNLVSPRFWSMLRDLRRFYRDAPGDLGRLDETRMTLGAYLKAENYGEAFRDDHLLPMAAAIWSAPPHAMLDYPAASFVRFQENHGLLKLTNRPVWRTVSGGSRSYVARLTKPYRDRIRLNAAVGSIARLRRCVEVRERDGRVARYDHVVIATHADQALAMLADPSAQERALLARISLQPQSRGSAQRRWLDAEAAFRVVELELSRSPQCGGKRGNRFVLDEPAAELADLGTTLRHSQSEPPPASRYDYSIPRSTSIR